MARPKGNPIFRLRTSTGNKPPSRFAQHWSTAATPFLINVRRGTQTPSSFRGLPCGLTGLNDQINRRDDCLDNGPRNRNQGQARKVHSLYPNPPCSLLLPSGDPTALRGPLGCGKSSIFIAFSSKVFHQPPTPCLFFGKVACKKSMLF